MNFDIYFQIKVISETEDPFIEGCRLGPKFSDLAGAIEYENKFVFKAFYGRNTRLIICVFNLHNRSVTGYYEQVNGEWTPVESKPKESMLECLIKEAFSELDYEFDLDKEKEKAKELEWEKLVEDSKKDQEGLSELDIVRLKRKFLK